MSSNKVLISIIKELEKCANNDKDVVVITRVYLVVYYDFLYHKIMYPDNERNYLRNFMIYNNIKYIDISHLL